MAKKLIVAALALLALVLAVTFWRQENRVEQAERDAGLAASRTLSAVFARTSRLQVAELTGEAVTRVEGRSAGVFGNVQTTRAPYAVGYFVDVGRLRPRDYRWDRERRTMTVTIAEVTATPPRIDLAAARTDQSGLFVSRASGLAMQRRVAANLTLAAAATANRPDQLTRAQAAAREAVASLVEAPLAAAGLGDVTVRVRLAGEARAGDGERWDASRPVAEVLRNAN